MTKEEIYDEFQNSYDFWNSVPEKDKPVVLATFYLDMTDAQKDAFLRETGELCNTNIF
jgi:hypothetical protein